MFALLSREPRPWPTMGEGGPLFSVKKEKGEDIFERRKRKKRKEGWHESRAGQVHARIGHNEANQPAKCTHNRQQTVYYIGRETVAKTGDLYLSFYLSHSYREICRVGL